MTKEYNPHDFERSIYEKQVSSNLYKTADNDEKPPYYVLDMFPYPSGEGLHAGHARIYTCADIYARMKRMQGYNVLHPTGWDAFGLPAEAFAIKNKVHPSISVSKNCNTFREQMKELGVSFDFTREINTTDPSFYKWTQWIFLQVYKRGLAWESFEPINWCPSCKTGLANEDLEDGTCERCNTVVERRPMRQWVLDIKKYANRLVDDLDGLSKWPESLKDAQRNWIGRSYGSEIDFPILDTAHHVKVFTTRADTLAGCTYLVLAPEHSLIEKLFQEKILKNIDDIKNYQSISRTKSDLERSSLGKSKTGVLLEGLTATNPLTKENIPVYIADYVLASYATGAIMAVPAHDERDLEFAQSFNIPIRQVVEILDKNDGPYDDKYREGIETVPRDNVVVVVTDEAGTKTLISKWKKVKWNGFITGGLDGKDFKEAAVMELVEEAGYTDIKEVKVFDESVHGLFYHVGKNTNRLAHYRVVHITLASNTKQEVGEEELDIADFVWVDIAAAYTELTRADMRRAYDIVYNSSKIISQKGIVSHGPHKGLTSEQSFDKLLQEKISVEKVSFKLNDWVFSRQRYWGEPIPIVHDANGKVFAVRELDLPVKLPQVQNYEPTDNGESPLANISEWVNVKGYIDSNNDFVQSENTPDGFVISEFKRETNTMPQWAGSSWYYLRFANPDNNECLLSKEAAKRFSPVNVYVGGAEHSTRHLIYARFWHKFLFDIGVVKTEEPFERIELVGLVLGPDGSKMSKRSGNVVNPSDIIKTFGADTARTYIAFMGNFYDKTSWNEQAIMGSRRFLEKVWSLQNNITSDVYPNQILLNQTIKKVTDDIESFRFNTAVSTLMILVTDIQKSKLLDMTTYKTLLVLLSPIAPHITDILFREVGGDSVHSESWPVCDESNILTQDVTLAVSINGKLRGTVKVLRDLPDDEVLNIVKEQSFYATHVRGGEYKKVIVVKNKIVNIVV